MRKRFGSAAVAAALLVLSSACFGQEACGEWRQIRSCDGITGYARSNPRSPINEAKAIGVVDAPVAVLEAVVRDAARRMIAKLDQQPLFLNLIFIEVVEFKSKHVPLLFELFFPPMLEFVQRLQTLGGLKPDLPLPVVLRSFVGLFFSFVITDMLIGQQMPMGLAPDALENYISIYLRGILVEG